MEDNEIRDAISQDHRSMTPVWAMTYMVYCLVDVDNGDG